MRVLTGNVYNANVLRLIRTGRRQQRPWWTETRSEAKERERPK